MLSKEIEKESERERKKCGKFHLAEKFFSKIGLVLKCLIRQNSLKKAVRVRVARGRQWKLKAESKTKELLT